MLSSGRALIVVGAFLTAVMSLNAEEPNYQGKSLPYWIEVFKHPKDEQASKDAHAAIVKIGAPAVSPLVEILRDRGTAIETTNARRLGAAMMLGEIGAAARDALPALREAEKSDPFFLVRVEAGAAIKKIEKK